jgi:hypothetical protein
MTVADYTDCILDEARFFDPETRLWGYEVICCHLDHQDAGGGRCPRP